jgi:hypothetical protein
MNYAGHHVLSAITPTTVESPLAVGFLWSDTSDNSVKVCTSLSPITFSTISGGSTISPSATVAALDGTGDAGVSADYSRGDHKHADANRPTNSEKAAFVGTNGTPSGTNPFVTDSDPRNTNARTPTAHATSHQNGGSDEISVVGLSGLLADGQTPLAHATSHKSGGSDAIKLDELAAPTDVTTLNVTSTAHGLSPKSPADATQFLNGAATPAYAAVKDSDLSTSDITTNDVSTTKHGFAPKAPNDATKFLDGTGAYSVPASGAGFDLLQIEAMLG